MADRAMKNGFVVYLEKLLFPHIAANTRRRYLKFLLLGIGMGACVSVAFGLILYLLNQQGRI
jgi:hypothetical protein